jgi:NAD(P)H-hydrate repair Nnr-like enzyme with NAD(P)H-hydrate dehydratase domain
MADFIRQTSQPAFPKVLWNRPVTRAGAGRLLVVGGNRIDFSVPQKIYQMASATGVGDCLVLLPDVLQPLLSGMEMARFVPSSPTGSLDKGALGQILAAAEHADALIIGGNLTASSHTTLLLESLLQKLTIPIILFDEALPALKFNAQLATDNPKCLIVANLTEVFRLASAMGVALPVKPERGLLNKVEIVQALGAVGQASYLVYGPELIAVTGEEASVTPFVGEFMDYGAMVAAIASVFWLQNERNKFASLTTGVFIAAQAAQNTKTADHPQAVSHIVQSISNTIKKFAE